MPLLHVNARWDAHARVWWAESDDLVGLVTEAATHDALVANVLALAPDLIELNLPHLKVELKSQRVDIEIHSEQVETLSVA